MKPHIYKADGRWTWDYYGKAKAPSGTIADLIRMNVAATVFCNRANEHRRVPCAG